MFSGRVLAGFMICLMVCLASCKGIQKENIIYQSDFENDSLTHILDGKIETFNGSKVLGRFSENGFNLRLKDIKPYDLLEISFDLYIHDTWDGNTAKPNGPDIWIMNINNWSAVYATFANGECIGCTQSYPVTHPSQVNNSFVFFDNRPNSNAIKTDLPGACEMAGTKGGTSMYRIVRTIEYAGTTLDLGCFAQLEDPDPANKNCKESWSVDNIRIKTIEFK